MDRIAVSSMRGCIRGVGRCPRTVEWSKFAGSRRYICLATTSSRATPTYQPQAPRITQLPRLTVQSSCYSTSQSTPLGTISSGAAGVTPPSDHTLTKLLAPDHLDANEKEIFDKINAELSPTRLDVKDISGGCGSMYGIEVESEKFRGLSMLKQQRLVNAVVKEKMDREGWHGVQLRTKVPEK